MYAIRSYYGPLPAEVVDFPHGRFLQEGRDVGGVEQDDGRVSERVQHRQIALIQHRRLGKEYVGCKHDDPGEERRQVLPDDQADLIVRLCLEDRFLLRGKFRPLPVFPAGRQKQQKEKCEGKDSSGHWFMGRRNPRITSYNVCYTKLLRG